VLPPQPARAPTHPQIGRRRRRKQVDLIPLQPRRSRILFPLSKKSTKWYNSKLVRRVDTLVAYLTTC
jgi:hypothetical protein